MEKKNAALQKIEGDRRFHSSVLDNVKDSVISTDLDGKITYWNRGASAIFGYSQDEMLGEPITKLSFPKYKKKDAAHHLEFLKQRTPISDEWQGVHKNGDSVFLLLTYLPMRNKEGQMLGLVRLGKDLTEHKKVEEALKASEIRYRRLFEAAQDGILLLDAKTGQITDVNPYLFELLGYSKEEMIDKKIWEIGAFADRNISKAGFKFLQEKSYIHYENMPLKTRNGHFIEVEFVSNLYLVEGLKVIQCNIRDITKRKKAEKALRETEEKLVEQNILLEQKNTALREIINQNRDEKERVEKQVQANVEHLIMPVIEKLKGKGSILLERYISLLETNLREITSGFGNDISSRMLRLTKKEIDICNMVKNGLASKEIAESLHISIRTIETHRNSIRKKLSIAGKNINLATYLAFLG